MRKFSVCFVAVSVALVAAMSGCSSRQPVTMAPPVPQPAVMQNAPMPNPSGGFDGPDAPAPENGAAGNVFQWNDTPINRRIPIIRAVFDQGGYQLFAQSGETIVVPFVNQNLYVMKFGQSSDGSRYFVNDGTAPTLFVPSGGYVENAAAQGARWYPFSNNYQYSRPVYIGVAPSWADYLAMGWYSGMLYHGGYWGYNPWRPGFGYSPMVGLNINIGGRPYYGYDSYRNYYNANPYNRVYVNRGPAFNYNSVGRRPGSSFSANGGGRRSTGSFGGAAGTNNRSNSTGSFGRASGGNNNFGTATNRPGGSFGRSPSTLPGPSGAFGRSGGFFGGVPSGGRQSGGSFGSGATGGGRSSGSFGSSGATSGFGSSGRSRGSFGGGASGYSRPSGSFGGSSGGSSSFGRSSGGSSFGGSARRSGGSSFGGGGGRRRR